MSKPEVINKELPAVKVNQWLPAWSAVKWSKKEHRSEPQRWFYQFSISAGYLKVLSGRVWMLLYRMQFEFLSGVGGAKLWLDAKNSEGPKTQLDVVGVEEDLVLIRK